jgi:hypothetical protein
VRERIHIRTYLFSIDQVGAAGLSFCKSVVVRDQRSAIKFFGIVHSFIASSGTLRFYLSLFFFLLFFAVSLVSFSLTLTEKV